MAIATQSPPQHTALVSACIIPPNSACVTSPTADALPPKGASSSPGLEEEGWGWRRWGSGQWEWNGRERRGEGGGKGARRKIGR